MAAKQGCNGQYVFSSLRNPSCADQSQYSKSNVFFRHVEDRNQIGGNDIRTIGVGNSGSGCERSGRFIFVNAIDAISFEWCAASGIPGTGPDTLDLDVVGEADEACRTWAPACTGGSRAEDTTCRVLCCSCPWIRVIKVDLFPLLWKIY